MKQQSPFKGIKNSIFTILGFITIVFIILGPLIIFLLLALLTKKYLLFTIIAIVYHLLDFWRHKSFDSQGYKPIMGKYEKNIENLSKNKTNNHE